MLNLATIDYPDPREDLNTRLSDAHAVIERTFLDGGEVLVSVMDIVTELIGILDGMAGTMDGGTAENAIAGLHRTMGNLARLPETEGKRQLGFGGLAALCSSAEGDVEEIREIFRYLKTFAVTVKITGASLTEFAAFAEEIRQRINSGADEVGKFAGHLSRMRSQLGAARAFSSDTMEDFNATIPKIIAGLSENSDLISQQHQQMAEIAAQVKRIAQGVQGKVAAALSSLQIGDITRQRIEHVQSMLAMTEDCAPADGAVAPGDDGPAKLRNAVSHLANAQLEETAADFRRECRKIFLGISSFTEDAAKILSLRDNLIAKSGPQEGNVLSLMEKDIARACELATRVQASSAEADEVVRSVTDSAQQLLRGIEILRAIKTDIHYMALNSNLRCSKLGDEGRSVNVVSAELRTFAGKLETPADAIVEKLEQVETATKGLFDDASGASGDLGAPLQEALAAIHAAKVQMEEGMDALGREGQAVFNRISAAIVKLDFESNLGNALDECRDLAAALAVGAPPDVAGFDERVIPFAMKIYKLYTMAQERDIHRKFLPIEEQSGSASAAPAAGGSADEDDDLFADSLF